MHGAERHRDGSAAGVYRVSRRSSVPMIAALATLAALLAGAPTQADGTEQVRALLVGVSQYPTLPPSFQLRGPRDDVIRLRDVLRRTDVSEIIVVADGVPGAWAEPTRDAIFQAMDVLRAQSHPGDWVFLYLAGHGSQQPQPSPLPTGMYREPDGMDEIFLPRDIERWDSLTRTVRGSIVDDEIGLALRRFIDQGISVWIVLDTCHAGDMTKTVPGLSGYRKLRSVPPEALGVPDVALPETADAAIKAFPLLPTARFLGHQQARIGAAAAETSAAASRDSGTRSKGQWVAFYATQFDEPEPEEWFPLASSPAGGRVGGVFSAYLIDALSAFSAQPNLNFSNLMANIQDRYRSDGRPFPRPYADGTSRQVLSETLPICHRSNSSCR